MQLRSGHAAIPLRYHCQSDGAMVCIWIVWWCLPAGVKKLTYLGRFLAFASALMQTSSLWEQQMLHTVACYNSTDMGIWVCNKHAYNIMRASFGFLRREAKLELVQQKGCENRCVGQCSFWVNPEDIFELWLDLLWQQCMYNSSGHNT